MTDPSEVVIRTFCLQIASDKSLRHELVTWFYHLSEIRAFKVHLKSKKDKQ